MKLQDLIGRIILDVKMEISDMNYNGSIPLEQSNSCILLDSGEMFEIPFSEADEATVIRSTAENQASIFVEIADDSFWSRYFKTDLHQQILMKRNAENIKGKKIVAVYQFDSGYSEKGIAWDQCIIEVETGFLISEVSISPAGTGHAGIWIFTSKSDLIEKIGDGYRRVY